MGHAALLRFKNSLHFFLFHATDGSKLKFNEIILVFNLLCTDQRNCADVLTHNIGKADSCV